MTEPIGQYNILVTRPKHQADNLCGLIEEQGWNAIRFPTLEIVALNNGKIRQQIDRIYQYQWLIFISVNAVNFALNANDGKIEKFKQSSIAAVGKATEKSLHTIGLPVVLIPDSNFNTEGLLATKEMNNVKGTACLIVRGDGGREILANTLRERGATVDYMEVYGRKMPVCNNLKVENMLKLDSLNVITITSGDALKNLLAMIAKELHDKLISIPLIVISKRIKELAEQKGFKHVIVTKKLGDAAIIEAAVEIRALGARGLLNSCSLR
ncbi:MAG: uroporphyrinogen-III synthase [Methylococcaceae bacterium]|nr:uroporphyrinogen-III synthase [Methylococcaceae bacterium]